MDECNINLLNHCMFLCYYVHGSIVFIIAMFNCFIRLLQHVRGQSALCCQTKCMYVCMYPVAFDTALGVLLFVARHTDRLLVTWYERLHAYWLTTHFTAETFLVKLFPFELVFLHPFKQYQQTSRILLTC